jgi:hypothetical protein
MKIDGSGKWSDHAVYFFQTAYRSLLTAYCIDRLARPRALSCTVKLIILESSVVGV